MSNKVQVHDKKLPTIQELYDNTDLAIKHDDLNVLLSQNPPTQWVKINKFANGSKYLPIDKVEWLLRRIFKEFRIEITGQGQAFNGVWVSVRVHYKHPVTGEWQYHDGIGAQEMQVKSGSSAADLANINRNAISMAFPIAKSYAVKDACDHFGSAFGANLNRTEVMPYNPDEKLQDIKLQKEIDRLRRLIDSADNLDDLYSFQIYVHGVDDEELTAFFNEKEKGFKNG